MNLIVIVTRVIDLFVFGPMFVACFIKADTVILQKPMCSWGECFSVTIGDFTLTEYKIWKWNLYLTEN